MKWDGEMPRPTGRTAFDTALAAFVLGVLWVVTFAATCGLIGMVWK